MDREFLADLFAPFGPVTIRRMFSGFGVSADGVTFALVIRDAIYLRTDADGAARFEAEGSRPFRYDTRTKTVTVGSYWLLPERLLDDPDELAEWARSAHAAAERAAFSKASKTRRGPKGKTAADSSKAPKRTTPAAARKVKAAVKTAVPAKKAKTTKSAAAKRSRAAR
ncbi:TfoX/Sxy family protein [Rhodopseudomonas palustris]|uniref:TfoX/Sxy family protein n=1 Tax=Rhodopseudomonas palustris TaxID=1076 RepID=UPI000E5C011E|nr:TfoX/Sxy family protein [Rhodopseudomonas palustris]QLH71479.1 TfoX/Sxy family protein [Rhodopseudomonas palustris]RIA02116.1 TfoX family protein [Rhodopseudomonas palustris]